MKNLIGVNFRAFEGFFKSPAASGIVLGVCTVLAMIIANTGWSSSYFDLLHFPIGPLSIQHWINDGLMAIFFFVIGMEIKKEIVVGELSSPRKAALPIAAAIGGMIVPAFIYILFNRQQPELRGWGVPMATDIAFALGILALFGKRVPSALKIFLLAIAIVDDIGAVLVIAFFYTENIKAEGLSLAVAMVALITLFRAIGVRSYAVYTIVGVLAWIGVLISGVHATVAGVVIGLLTPFRYAQSKGSNDKYSPLDDLVHRLHPWVNFVIMPLFALANAGISFAGIQPGNILSNSIFLGISFGLFIGKPVGITLFCLIAKRLKLGVFPTGLRWSHIIAISFLGGIGFTMSLFISGLALPSNQDTFSKSGIIAGSVAAAAIGSLMIAFLFRNKNEARV